MANVLAAALAIAAVGGGLSLLERRFRARTPAPIFARARLVDYAHWAIGTPLSGLFADVAFAIAMVLALPPFLIARAGLEQPGHPYITPFMHLPLAVQVPAALLLSDFFGYWSHRLHHQRPLWRFHAIHHSPRELDWIAGARNHPIAEAAGRICIGIPLILLGVDFRVFVLVGPFVGIWALFLHANVRWTFGPLRYVVATPFFHRWHHSRAPEARDKNFAGLFPIWDVLFGTLHLPDRQPDDFGVDDAEGVPGGFFAQLVHPFRRR